MYKISKEYHWCMGHALAHHKGKCYRPHGHNYRAVVTVSRGIDMDHTNMLVDFADLNKVMDPILETLDHNFFYNHQDKRGVSFRAVGAWPWFRVTGASHGMPTSYNCEPTAEGIAEHIATKFAAEFDGFAIDVEVHETPKCSASFSIPENRRRRF